MTPKQLFKALKVRKAPKASAITSIIVAKDKRGPTLLTIGYIDSNGNDGYHTIVSPRFEVLVIARELVNRRIYADNWRIVPQPRGYGAVAPLEVIR